MDDNAHRNSEGNIIDDLFGAITSQEDLLVVDDVYFNIQTLCKYVVVNSTTINPFTRLPFSNDTLTILDDYRSDHLIAVRMVDESKPLFSESRESIISVEDFLMVGDLIVLCARRANDVLGIRGLSVRLGGSKLSDCDPFKEIRDVTKDKVVTLTILTSGNESDSRLLENFLYKNVAYNSLALAIGARPLVDEIVVRDSRKDAKATSSAWWYPVAYRNDAGDFTWNVVDDPSDADFSTSYQDGEGMSVNIANLVDSYNANPIRMRKETSLGGYFTLRAYNTIVAGDLLPDPERVAPFRVSSVCESDCDDLMWYYSREGRWDVTSDRSSELISHERATMYPTLVLVVECYNRRRETPGVGSVIAFGPSALNLIQRRLSLPEATNTVYCGLRSRSASPTRLRSPSRRYLWYPISHNGFNFVWDVTHTGDVVFADGYGDEPMCSDFIQLIEGLPDTTDALLNSPLVGDVAKEMVRNGGVLPNVADELVWISNHYLPKDMLWHPYYFSTSLDRIIWTLVAPDSSLVNRTHNLMSEDEVNEILAYNESQASYKIGFVSDSVNAIARCGYSLPDPSKASSYTQEESVWIPKLDGDEWKWSLIPYKDSWDYPDTYNGGSIDDEDEPIYHNIRDYIDSLSFSCLDEDTLKRLDESVITLMCNGLWVPDPEDNVITLTR